MLSIPEFNDYQTSKARDPLTSKPDKMAPALRVLDRFIIEQLYISDQIHLNNSEDSDLDRLQIELLTDTIQSIKKYIVTHPDSSWSMSKLEYRIRQEHYK